MNQAKGSKTKRLADVELALLEAETAFQDAERRSKEAQRDLDAALQRINKHQLELDQAVAEMRRRSPEGSHWQAGEFNGGELLLSLEQVSQQPEDTPLANIHNLSVHFDRLKAVVGSSTSNES